MGYESTRCGKRIPFHTHLQYSVLKNHSVSFIKLLSDGGEIVLELAGAAGTDDDAGDALLLENPLEGFLGEGDASGLCFVVPLVELMEQFRG